jgi:hypothetical protein
VLCGNAVFQTGSARCTQQYPYSSGQSSASPAIPPIVFFRDAGNDGSALTAVLPQTNAPCPAPSPANVYTFTAPVFNQIGQSEIVYYWCSSQPDSMTFSTTDAAVAAPSPSAVPIPSAAPTVPPWPPASYATFTATGYGNAQIVATDPGCTGNDTTFNVVVNHTPTPAPAPTPIPN